MLRRIEWAQWIILAAMFAASAAAWPQVGPRVPMHWNIRGEVDGYGGRVEGLLFVPVLAVGIYALLRVLPRLDPARANYPAFAGSYAVIRLALTALFGAVHGVVLAAALGAPVEVGRLVPAAVGGLFVVIGSVLGRVRPNYFVGIRTPWTLASARSWERTHRVGGRVFAAAGVSFVVAGLTGVPALFVAALVLDGIALVGVVVYSYLVWRDDPERTPAFGAPPDA